MNTIEKCCSECSHCKSIGSILECEFLNDTNLFSSINWFLTNDYCSKFELKSAKQKLPLTMQDILEKYPNGWIRHSVGNINKKIINIKKKSGIIY